MNEVFLILSSFQNVFAITIYSHENSVFKKYVITVNQITVFQYRIAYLKEMYILESNFCQNKYGKVSLMQNPKQLILQADNDGLFYSPVHFCKHGRYRSN